MKKTVAGLVTIRDFIRYAVSRFEEAGLFYGHGTFNSFEEAIFIVMGTLNLPLGDLDPWWEARLTPIEQKKVLANIHARIKTRKPAAYILKKTWLQDMEFYVDERVIVPRSFIAELMVEGLSGVEDFPLIEDPMSVKSVLDLCTGSGCLAILASRVFPNASVDAVDLSPGAVAVAKRNVADYGLEERVTVYKGDLFQPLKGKKYDLIITNPPYVDAEDMKDLPPEYAQEPRMALAAGKDGLDIVRQIMREAPKYLNDGGGLICEIGEGKENVEATYPDVPFLWLDTENSTGEAFFLSQEQLSPKRKLKSV